MYIHALEGHTKNVIHGTLQVSIVKDSSVYLKMGVELLVSFWSMVYTVQHHTFKKSNISGKFYLLSWFSSSSSSLVSLSPYSGEHLIKSSVISMIELFSNRCVYFVVVTPYALNFERICFFLFFVCVFYVLDN